MADIDGFGKLFAEIDNMTAGMEDKEVVAGFVEGANYSDGTSIAAVAATQNFGTGRIPPRPFMSNAINDHENEWIEELSELIKEGKSVDDALSLVGQLMQSDIKEAIIDITSPPLAPLTMMIRKIKKERNQVGVPTTNDIFAAAVARLREGDRDFSGVNDKPLVDSKTMLTHVEFEVRK